ncbi:Paraflagellar rod protein, partial [Operophtera brumata]
MSSEPPLLLLGDSVVQFCSLRFLQFLQVYSQRLTAVKNETVEALIMDTSAGHSNPDPCVKKSPFDDLNREELISKCKGLLSLAQKAKLAKAEFQNEIESYKLQLEKCEAEKTRSQESNKILQELVDSLTEQKLNIITEVDSAQNKIKALGVQCKNYEHEINKYKADLIIKDQNISDISQKLSDLDSELISSKRQNKRLMEENEQLINQLTEIEARTAEFNSIGLEQREQLQLLEQHVLTDKEYKAEIEVLNNKIKELEDHCKVVERETTKQFEDKINELTQSCESEINKRDKVNVKLRSYKDKILKCAACINQLKNSRYILTKTVKEYSENIPKWQNDIIKASKVLDDQVNTLKNQNVSLNEKVLKLEEQLRQATPVVKDIVDEINIDRLDELRNENSQLQTQIAKIQQQFSDCSCHNDKIQQELNELHSKYEALIQTELSSHVAENNSLKDQINDNITTLNNSTEKNKELMKSLQDLNIEKERLNEALQNNDLIECLSFQIKALESEKFTLVKEKLNAKDSVIELENINKRLTEQVSNMKTDFQTMKAQLESLVHKNNVLFLIHKKNDNDSEINMLKCKIMEQQDQFNLMQKEYENMQDLNNLLKEEVDTLKFSLEQPKDDSEHSDLNVSLQTDIVKLETKLAAYKHENSSLLIEMKESRNKIKEHDALVSEYDDTKSKLMSYKNENAELLHEMKEINQVLKERGESISKQQKAISEMERLIETLEKDRNNLNEEKTTLHDKVEALQNEFNLAEKKRSENSEFLNQIILERDNAKRELTENENLILSLKDEVEKLKQTPASADLPNEDMSTSTISKVEEFSRMRDLDETFEEKYTKLRIFALKLKKKLNETTAILQSTEQDKAKLEKMLSENETKSTVSDNQTSHNKSESNINDQLEVSELKEKVRSLTAFVEASEKEIDKLKAEINTKSHELASEIEAHKTTKDDLEKAKRTVKKKNVLSLEIEDYERSLKELSTKMEEKKKKMVQMESTIDTQEGTITAMKTQIKLLEEQIKAEETQNRLIKEELQHIIEEGKDKDSVIQNKIGIISKLVQDLEDEKRKNEEADLEMTELISDKEKLIMSLGEDKAELNQKVRRLEFKCAEMNEKLKILNMELADLKTEHTSYKSGGAVEGRGSRVEGADRLTHLETIHCTVSTLTQCYKTQISELEAKLQKDTELLKKQLTAAVESARGSESAPSPPPSKQYFPSSGSGRSPVSLERLLEEGVPEDESLDTSSLALTSDQEIADLKRRLTAQQL